MNFTKIMGSNFSYLIYTKNIKQKLRRQLQGFTRQKMWKKCLIKIKMKTWIWNQIKTTKMKIIIIK
jgi:hypothetical protein